MLYLLLSFLLVFFFLLHIGQLLVNHAIHERPALANQLRLQALLNESTDLLLSDGIEVNFAEAALDGLDDHGVVRAGTSAAKVDLAHRAGGALEWRR